MKITPIASAAQVADMSTPDHVRTAKAVAAFNKGQSSYDKPQANQQPTQQVVQNQNAIEVEELGAVRKQEASNQTPMEGTEQPPAVSADTPPPSTKAAVDPAVSRQFAQLARQTKEVRQAQQQLKAEKAALAAERAALKPETIAPDLTNYIDRERLTSDPLSVLAEAGISYEALTQQILNQQPTDPRVQATIAKLEAKIAQLEKGVDEGRKTYTENQQQAYQAAVKQIRTDVKQLVHTDPTFETIKATKSVDDVVELIEQTYAKDGVLLSVEEAAQQVEDYLVEEGYKLATLSKIQKRLQSNRTANATLQAPQTQNAQPPQQRQTNTLTNAIGSTRKLSVRERAIAAMEGRLK